MNRNIIAAIIAGIFIGILFIPVGYNFGLFEMVHWLIVALVLAVGTVAGVVIASAIGKRIPVIFQVAKFGVVGVLNTLVDFGVLNIFIAVFSISAGMWYSVFKAASFIVAAINSYVWNKFWTFESKEKANTKEATSFFIVSAIGFLINVISASVVVNVITPFGGASSLIWANIGALVGTLLGLAWNFVGYKFFVFKNNDTNLRIRANETNVYK